MKKEKAYEVTIFVDDMQFPEVATLEIVAGSKKEAIAWVRNNMRLSADEL